MNTTSLRCRLRLVKFSLLLAAAAFYVFFGVAEAIRLTQQFLASGVLP